MVLNLTISNFNFLYLDVWDAMASTSGQDKTPLQCKKCGDAHSKPINAKCEKVKETKDEKKDGSKEHMSAKKTPRTKSCEGSNDKVLDLVMSTMSTFTAKLNAMEARLTGLSSHVEDTPLQSKKRKSGARNICQLKRLHGLIVVRGATTKCWISLCQRCRPSQQS